MLHLFRQKGFQFSVNSWQKDLLHFLVEFFELFISPIVGAKLIYDVLSSGNQPSYGDYPP